MCTRCTIKAAAAEQKEKNADRASFSISNMIYTMAHIHESMAMFAARTVGRRKKTVLPNAAKKADTSTNVAYAGRNIY